jgi:hypothetical protein
MAYEVVQISISSLQRWSVAHTQSKLASPIVIPTINCARSMEDVGPVLLREPTCLSHCYMIMML